MSTLSLTNCIFRALFSAVACDEAQDVEKTLTKEIFKSSLFERLRKAVNNAHFIVAGENECESSSSTSHLLEEQQDRLSYSMDDLFDQTAKDASLFSLA